MIQKLQIGLNLKFPKKCSEYWLSVITAGRSLSVASLMTPTLTDQDSSGHILSRLMTIADIITLQPKSVKFMPNLAANGKIVEDYLTIHSDIGIEMPLFSDYTAVDLKLQEHDDVALREYLLTDTAKLSGKSKMRKSFCAPGNTSFCPALEYVRTFVKCTPWEFHVPRKERDGGPISYNSLQALIDDFAEEKLHPGDLKDGVANLLIGIMESMEGKLTKELKDSMKVFKQYEKKCTKAKIVLKDN